MHKNNFDFLRLVFAVFVIITHSYSISGIKEIDILSQLTNGQTALSYVGVRGFFIISGYLIFQSLQRSSSVGDYFWKRFLRLFPGLIVVLALTVILCFFVYDGTFLSYLSNKSMLFYFPNNLSLYNLQFGITGVLKGAAINGSLWTIRYEFSFYLLISALFILRDRNKVVNIILISMYCIMLMGKFYMFEKMGPIGSLIGNSMSVNLGLFFIGGSALAAIKIEHFKFKRLLLSLGLLFLVLSFYFSLFHIGQFIFLPVVVLLVGISSTKYLRSISDRFGDISYGLYIYSFPIQVTLMYFYKLNYLQLMVFSIFLAVLFGFFSWHLIEKRALEYKNIYKNRL